MEKQRIYFCIDMKSFFASVECAELGLIRRIAPWRERSCRAAAEKRLIFWTKIGL